MINENPDEQINNGGRNMCTDITTDGKRLDGELNFVSADTESIDLLGRDEIIEKIKNLIDTVCNRRGSCTFALSGEWGVGKTFVLNKLENDLSVECDGNKYLVFHYNAWEYDYYDEPLISIVTSMQDWVERENALITPDVKENIKGLVTAIQNPAKKIIEKAVGHILEEKLGLTSDDLAPVKDIISTATGMKADFDQSKEESGRQKEIEHSYDSYFGFRKVLEDVRKNLEQLSERHIIFVVDELDRCVPEYSIKVLERLHHIFYKLDNCSVIIAVDKSQLEYAVKHVFGDKTNTDRYLKKFISFDVKLDIGKIQAPMKSKYPEYFEMFESPSYDGQFDENKYCAVALYGISPRTQQRIIERLTTIHKLVFGDQTVDYAVLCFELFWCGYMEYYKGCKKFPLRYSENMFLFGNTESMTLNMEQNQYINNFNQYMRDEWSKYDIHDKHHTTGYHAIEYDVIFLDPNSVPMRFIWLLSRMFDQSKEKYFILNEQTINKDLEYAAEHLKKLMELLDIIVQNSLSGEN